MKTLATLRGRPSETVYTEKGIRELKAFKKRVIVSLSRERITEETYKKIIEHLDAIFEILKNEK